MADRVAGADARLRANADRYAFARVGLHHLLLSGFDRRIANQVSLRFVRGCACQDSRERFFMAPTVRTAVPPACPVAVCGCEIPANMRAASNVCPGFPRGVSARHHGMPEKDASSPRASPLGHLPVRRFGIHGNFVRHRFPFPFGWQAASPGDPRIQPLRDRLQGQNSA